MTLRERFGIIGQAIRLGEIPTKEVDKKKSVTLGGFIDLFQSDLSSSTKVSSKLLEANNGWVYRNNDVIAKEVAQMEYELFTVRIVGKDIEFVPIVSHPLLDILDKMNEFTTKYEGLYTTASHRNLAGDAFWLKDGKGIGTKGLYLLPPDKIELKLGEEAGSTRIIEGYKYQDNVNGKTIERTYPADEVIHFKVPNPKNPYRGYSKVEAAAEAIDIDNFAQEAQKALFKRGMLTNFVLTTPKNVTDEQMQQLRAELKANYSGVNNFYRTMILSGDLKPESIQQTNKELQFMDLEEWLRDKITSIFGNNKAVIGVTDDVNRANADASILHWKRTTVKTEMKGIVDTLNEFFVPEFGSNLLLAFKNPVPEDEEEDIDQIKILVDSNIITRNEARERLGLDPVDGGDNLLDAPVIQPGELPNPVKNVSYQKHLRRMGIYKQLENRKQIIEMARPIAKKVVQSRKKSPEVAEEIREHHRLTNEEVWEYHNKQMSIVDTYEVIFDDAVTSYIQRFYDKALAQVPQEVTEMRNKQLIDEDEEIELAEAILAPILMQVAALTGQQALSLIKVDTPYIPTSKIRSTVSKNVRLFAKSMVETNKDKLINIITQGIIEGQSVADIVSNMRSQIPDLTKTQATRVTRTEVIRTHNLASIDAWEESGVVSGKQWLTAEDDRVDPLCMAMNGKVIDLQKTYFRKGDVFSVDLEDGKIAKTTIGLMDAAGPPLHVNCRCDLLPVLIGELAFDADTYVRIRDLESRAKELEAKIDKRTKKYRKLNSELTERNLELEQYVKELEGLVDEELENTQD